MAYKAYDDERDEDTYDPAEAGQALAEGDENEDTPQEADPSAPSDDKLVDRIPSSQAAPAQKQASLSDYFVTREDLQKAQAEKKKLAVMGSVVNSLSNRQGAGNFLLGTLNAKHDISPLTKALSDNADAPIQQKQTLMAQELKKPEMQYMQKATDPNSDLSQSSVKLHQALLEKYGAQLGKSNPKLADAFNSVSDSLDGKSAYDVQNLIDKSGLSKIMSSEDMASMRAQLMATLSERRLSQGDERINIQRDNQAANAAGAFDKDHILTQLTTQQQQIRRDKHTLENAQTLTPQMFNEINLGIANAISGGRSAAVTTQGKVEYDSLALKWTEMKQRLENSPQDIGSPQVKSYISDVLSRLDNAYSNNMKERAQQMSVGRNYGHNPAAQNAVQQKMSSYGQDSGSDGQSAGYAVIPSAQADQEYVNVVSPEGKSGRIPKANLGKALSRGFKQVN